MSPKEAFCKMLQLDPSLLSIKIYVITPQLVTLVSEGSRERDTIELRYGKRLANSAIWRQEVESIEY
jgi:hypothetical protein